MLVQNWPTSGSIQSGGSSNDFSAVSDSSTLNKRIYDYAPSSNWSNASTEQVCFSCMHHGWPSRCVVLGF
jgi:hypothetical protein